jgi:hypothetical protein
MVFLTKFDLLLTTWRGLEIKTRDLAFSPRNNFKVNHSTVIKLPFHSIFLLFKVF